MAIASRTRLARLCLANKKLDKTGESVKIKEEVRLLYGPQLETDSDHILKSNVIKSNSLRS